MDERRRSQAGLAVGALALLLALPVLYALSIGPVMAFYIGRETPTGVHEFYTPLTWVVNNYEVANSILDWYLGFWLPVP